jgi:hypothetical protein
VWSDLQEPREGGERGEGGDRAGDRGRGEDMRDQKDEGRRGGRRRGVRMNIDVIIQKRGKRREYPPHTHI